MILEIRCIIEAEIFLVHFRYFIGSNKNSHHCDDFRELTEKLYESIKLLGNDVKCVDNPEDFDNLLAKHFAQLINEYETDDVIFFMQIVGLYFSLKTIASSN